MALRFRTRLTLTISFLVFLTVAAMTVSMVYILVSDLIEQYRRTVRDLETPKHLGQGACVGPFLTPE